MRSAVVIALGAKVALGQFMNTSRPSVPDVSTQATSQTDDIETTPAPQPTSSPNKKPLLVGDFQLYGCLASSAGFPGFKKVASAEVMGLDLCAASCPSRFFGVYSTNCYCGDKLDPASTTMVDSALCSTPCPGNKEETCGGLAAPSRKARRQKVPMSVVLSLYMRIRELEEVNPTVVISPTVNITVVGAQESDVGAVSTDTMALPSNITAPVPDVSGSTSAPGVTITSTVTSTSTGTITSCPPQVTDCPLGHKTTKVVTYTTELCPSPEWHKKKIVCYGGNCAAALPCNDDHCQRYRVICNGDHCRPEECSNKEEWQKLVICKGDNCHYHQCTGEECNTKVICYDGKCAKEHCYGDECHTKVVCNGHGEECRPQPPCHGVGCPVPPAPKPQPPCNGVGCPVPTPCYGPGCPVSPPCNGPGCPVPPPAPTHNQPGQNNPVLPVPYPPSTAPGGPIQTGPPVVVSGATKVGAGIVGAVLGFAILL